MFRLPDRPLTKSKRDGLTERKSPQVRTILRPHALPPEPGFESWVQRFEAQHRGGHALTKPLLPTEDNTMAQITLPRRNRSGAVTDEELKTLHADILEIAPGSRNAALVCSGMDSENSARGRARSFADRYEEAVKDGTLEFPDGHPQKDNPHRALLATHAVPDPTAADKWVGALSARPKDYTPRKPPAAKPKPAAGTPKPKPAAS